MYLRSPRFAECLQIMLDAGASIGDPLLRAILLDDDTGLRSLAARSSESLTKKLNPLCAFTSCRGVSPLHICAEFNSVRCARVLLENGADANARAEQDSAGIGGQTPVFHAVNSIFNYCRPTMEMLVDAGADLDIRVKALLWGESMTWETVVYDVTPLSMLRSPRSRMLPDAAFWNNSVARTLRSPNLARKFHMTLTGMQKHVGVLEQAGLVTTDKVGRVFFGGGCRNISSTLCKSICRAIHLP